MGKASSPRCQIPLSFPHASNPLRPALWLILFDLARPSLRPNRISRRFGRSLAPQIQSGGKTQGRSFCLAYAIEKLLLLHYGPGAGEKERTLSIYAQGLFISLFVPGRAGCCLLTKTENHPPFAEGRI